MSATVLPRSLLLCCLLALLACSRSAFTQYHGEHVRRVTLTPPDAPCDTLSFEQARERWMARLVLPDPLWPAPPTGGGRRSGGRGAVIRVWATLYDRQVEDAWIRWQARQDSISHQEAVLRYHKLHQPAERFRIELNMESGFAPESLDPTLWTLYLEDEEGIMYEPTQVCTSPVSDRQRRVHSELDQMTRTRHTYRRTVDLYFPRVAFFGKEVLGPDTRLLRLVFAHEQQTMGEAVWIFTAALKTP